MESAPVNKICIVVASELTVRAFLLHHLAALARDYNVTVVANFSDTYYLRKLGLPVSTRHVAIERKIAPPADLLALTALVRLFRAERYGLVHSVTPKAGLLAMLAAHLAGVPLRLHTFTGQVWVTRGGPMRTLLKAADRAIARHATQVLADSPSQRDFLISQGIVPAAKARVLAHGSISGVDTARFRPDAAARERVRAGLAIAPQAIVFLYLGRLSRDKGLLDLAQAFAAVGARHPNAHLLLVGPDEDEMREALVAACGACAAKLHFAGDTDQPQEYFAAADIFCLASYREGFGSTVIEAAAAGLPSIGSRIYGITDAIVEAETGLLFNVGDAQDLARCMEALARDDTLRADMGRRARERALRDFSAPAVTAALLQHYAGLFAAARRGT